MQKLFLTPPGCVFLRTMKSFCLFQTIFCAFHKCSRRNVANDLRAFAEKVYQKLILNSAVKTSELAAILKRLLTAMRQR